MDAIPREVPIILDGKRGDIAAAGRAYAHSAFEVLDADAITLTPYLGYDSITPFMNDPEKGVFLLCKTSNPGSVDLQDLPLGGYYNLMTVYEKIAGLATEWGAMNDIGLLVDAAFPDAIRRVRALAPSQWILAPGSGLTKADLRALLLAGLREDGLGLLINVDQEISHADDPCKASKEILEVIRSVHANIRPQPEKRKRSSSYLITPIVEGLLSMGCIRFGEFTLKSGLLSPIQIDLRQLISYPGWMTQVASAYIRALRTHTFDRIAGLPYAALPIATAISLQANLPMIYPREKEKLEQDIKTIEGIYHTGETVVLIDDLAITGQSSLAALKVMEEAGLMVGDVIVLIDCDLGAREFLSRNGYHLDALFTLTQLLDYWEETERVPLDQIANVRAFLKSHKAT
jgi:uridine monophosphate synthetase